MVMFSIPELCLSSPSGSVQQQAVDVQHDSAPDRSVMGSGAKPGAGSRAQLFTSGPTQTVHNAPSSSQSGSSSPLPEQNRVEQTARVDQNMVGRIARFQQLLHGPARLQKGDFIALDLDETLIMSRHSPSQLLTSRGVPAFRKYVHERFSDFKTKNDHCRKLQKALKDKVLVDQDCVRVIQTLQNMGVWVFGVTARYSEMAPATDACLRSLGLDLSVTAPFPKTALRDPDTDSYYADGVVYCNAMDKGSILDRFLENVVFRKVLADLEGPEGDVGDAESWRRARGLPGRLLFIDDRYENCQSVRHRLPTADRLSVQVEAYQFVPRWLSNTQAPNSLREAVLRVQMECFVDEGRILSDKEAAQTLTPPMHGTKIAVH